MSEKPRGHEGVIPQDGGVEKEKKNFLPQPENYVEPTGFPKFEIAKVRSGADTFAPNLGERFSFASEGEARAYVEYARKQNFQGTVELTRWNTYHEGETIETSIEIK